MKKCPVCQQEFSATYKHCPFCEEDAEELGEGKKSHHRNVYVPGHRTQPSILSPLLILTAVILVALLVILCFGSEPNPAVSDASGSQSAEPPSISSGVQTVPDGPGLTSLDSLPETMTLSHKDFTMNVGDTPVTLRVSGGGEGKTIHWYSDNESVATVDDNGKVVAVSAGDALVIASDGSGKGTCVVRVKGSGTPNTGSTATMPDGKEHKLNRDDVTLRVGEPFQLTVSGDVENITWASDNNSIVGVSDNGTLTCKAAGTTTVTASWDGASLSCIVRVKA